MPYILISVAVWLVSSFFGRERMGRFMLLLLCLWGGYEAFFGLMQLTGNAVSGHVGYAMTGNFSNPGPYGGFLSLSLSAGAAYLLMTREMLFKGKVADKIYDAAVAMSVFLEAIVLPATMSRTGWLAVAASVFICVLSEARFREWATGHRFKTGVASLLLVLCLAGAFFLKKESALGRLHIWRIECMAFVDNLPFGSGPGTVLGEYGKAQEAFFRETDRSGTAVRVAGCPEYAFNEYLGAGIEYGLPGLLLMLSVPVAAIWLLLRRRDPLGYTMVAISVFAFFSYPMSLWQFKVWLAVLFGSGFSLGCRLPEFRQRCMALLAGVVLSAAGGCLLYMDIRAEKETGKLWSEARYWGAAGLYEDSVESLSPLYDDLKDNYRYLYDLGYALHKTGRYGESNNMLHEGARLSSDPMFHNIIGRNHEALGEYSAAEEEYMISHYMVPSRLYPLVLLMDMYVRTGRTDDAAAVGERIASMPVNGRNMTMLGLRQETLERLDSLRNVVSYE